MASFLTMKKCSYKTEDLKTVSNTNSMSEIISNLENNYCRNENESKVNFFKNFILYNIFINLDLFEFWRCMCYDI